MRYAKGEFPFGWEIEVRIKVVDLEVITYALSYRIIQLRRDSPSPFIRNIYQVSFILLRGRDRSDS